MGTTGAMTRRQTATLGWNPGEVLRPANVAALCQFLDTATTSMGRATHYNTREEQQAAELDAHERLFNAHRGIYAALLTLPGVTDRAKQVGLKKLLSSKHDGNVLVDSAKERELLYQLMSELPPQRRLKIIEGFRVGSEELGLRKANNARTRKLILRTLFTGRLPFWAVKYRSKVRAALTHAWGRRKTSIVAKILQKRSFTEKEYGIIRQCIDRWVGGADRDIREAVCFVLGVTPPGGFGVPILKSFFEAKEDITKGKRLPLEVLEGIRGQYHKDIPKEEILKLAKGNLTKGQKLAVQKRAGAAGIEVEMDPLDYDAVKLYIYAFECGLTQEIAKALDAKGKKAAKTFPSQYETVGILVDASASMVGDRTQKLRPLAATLALRDMLQHTAGRAFVEYAGGQLGGGDVQLQRTGGTKLVAGPVVPSGDTDLATPLLKLLEREPETIFVLSDGYENAPAGRFGEVVRAVREIGIETPIYHLNPVFAAEATGVRQLADIPVLPAQSPQALGATFLRGLIEADPERGVTKLLEMVLQKELAAPKEKTIKLRDPARIEVSDEVRL